MTGIARVTNRFSATFLTALGLVLLAIGNTAEVAYDGSRAEALFLNVAWALAGVYWLINEFLFAVSIRPEGVSGDFIVVGLAILTAVAVDYGIYKVRTRHRR